MIAALMFAAVVGAPLAVSPAEGGLCHVLLPNTEDISGARAALVSDGEGLVLMLEASMSEFGLSSVLVDGKPVEAMLLNNSDVPDQGSVWVDRKLAGELSAGSTLDLPFTTPRTQLKLDGLKTAIPELLDCGGKLQAQKGAKP